MKLPTQSFTELAVVEAINPGRSDGIPYTHVFAYVPDCVRYYVNCWMLEGRLRYVFVAYSWTGKFLWQEVYSYDQPMYNASVWAKYFPLSRLESALRNELVRL